MFALFQHVNMYLYEHACLSGFKSNNFIIYLQMSVKVGVRVRPFNQRQADLNCKLCVDMIGNTTRLLNVDDTEKFRDFTFDYSFWSHDQFHTTQQGYFKADGDKYADQQQVFQKVGLQILSNAWQGYHCCLFAYGQTGSGKSYSMVGYGANKGIVPISFEEIFSRIAKNEDADKQYQVHVSMLQIYNERVQDLLIPMNKRSKEGLKIRESKTLGIYVQGLSKHYVDTYEAIQQKMIQGGKNRSIAATQMNASSSRAHTIISMQFRQKQTIQGKKRQKLSVIFLVDLAGSEKVGKTGATGDRLKQAAGINKSLSVLGLVISTLADKAMGKGKGTVVPYRDSCLTRILQNALGGNSKTLMICAISPATDNYEQTLSTLRYADQAKKIQNKAVVNESETDKIIRNLTQQKEDLMEKVAKFQQMFKKISMGLGVNQIQLQQFKDAKQQLKSNAKMMDDYSLTKEQKIENQKKWNDQFGSNKIDETKPHISNLNQDPMLNNKILHSIDRQITKIGRRNVEPVNNIQIGGMGIRNSHAAIVYDDVNNKIYIDPDYNEQNEDSGCYLNGDSVTVKTELMNYDRLTFGTNNMFLVRLPNSPIRDEIEINQIDWDFAQNQLYLRKQMVERQLLKEKQQIYKEQAEQKLRKKQEQLEQLQRKLLQNQKQRKNIEQQNEIQKAEIQKKLKEQQAQRLRLQIEKDKKTFKDRQTEQKQRIKQKYYFEKKLLKTLPKCIQLNLIAKQFRRNISMSVKMLLPNEKEDDLTGNGDEDIDLKRRSIKIKVVNREVGYTYWWDVDKLSNRYYIIKDMSETYFETGDIPELNEKEDPFWDPPEHVLIGRAFLTTKALSYMFDNSTKLSIIGEDDHCGQLSVNMVPTDQSGQRNLCEEMDEQQIQFQPEDLIDKPFFYNVLIQQANIPDSYENIYVSYAVKIDDKKSEVFKTEQVAKRTQNPIFNYKRLHHFQKVTDTLLTYLQTAKIVFKIYAFQLVAKQKKQTPAVKKQDKISQVKQTVTGPQSSMNQRTAASTVTNNSAIKTGKIEGSGLPKSTVSSVNTSRNATPHVIEMKKKKKEKQDCSIF